MADRFYCPDRGVEGQVTLSGDEAHHLARVRRVGPGMVVELFDGRGWASLAEVCLVERDRVELALVGEPLPDRAAPVKLTLATAVPKGDRFDWLVEKATELGVARLVPVITERSVVDPRGAKLERLRRVVVEAAKQCGRNVLMDLERPVPWPDYLGNEPAPLRLLAHPGGLPSLDWPDIESGQAVALGIGPEGGFTESEVEAASASGWKAVCLGCTLLRVETAGLAGAAAIFASVRGGTHE
ncbi:MAG TPA: RsmE family RNA methyltransferase [Isosphaeraceae bacterium]|nr:RsmE family RNA methyltransferase [Isosphaeraceae bacterium]